METEIGTDGTEIGTDGTEMEMENGTETEIGVELVKEEDLFFGRRYTRKKGEKYGKYAKAIKSIGLLQWIKKSISKNGVIRIKSKDIAKTLGGSFEKLHPTSLYWGVKYVLFHEDIFVDSATHKDGSNVLVMRTKTDKDKLPSSLTKNIEREKDGEKEESNGSKEEGQ